MTERQSILIVSNSPLHPSGVAGQCRHICKQLWRDGFEVHVIAYSLLADPAPREFHTWPAGEQVNIYNTKLEHEYFRDMPLLTGLIARLKPEALILFDDPRRFMALLDHSSFIRSKMPMLFVTVWDTWMLPHPKGIQHYNRLIYDNFDTLLCISRQTEWFCKEVYSRPYGDQRDNSTPQIAYVGHGSDPEVFKPTENEELKNVPHGTMHQTVFGDKEADFVVLMVNQNMLRKKFPDLIEAWRIFYETLEPERAAKCLLLLKTFVSGPYGTNLDQVISAIAPCHNVMLLASIVDEAAMNEIYNLADVVVNISNAEGFGLTINEGMLAGKPVIVNMTGGLCDQAQGEWAVRLDNQRTIIGSAMGTPYLYDENCSIDAVAKAIRFWYDLPSAERARRGLKGREFCLGRSGLNSGAFARAVSSEVAGAIKAWTPRPLFHIYKT
jgi:glycosyltransferase involved in cell wall biosynthesis